MLKETVIRPLLWSGMIAWLSAQALADVSPSFHAPTTTPEKKLDAILGHANADENLLDFILKRPWYKPAEDKSYASLFTQPLLNEFSRTESALKKKNCGGTYEEGEVCGLDYNPITCVQDPPTAYTYQTISATAHQAMIASKGAGYKQPTATYRLVMEDNNWKLDGVDCGKGASFHMKK